MIKVVVSFNDDVFGWLMRKFGGEWSHVGLVYNDGVVEALWKGVVSRSLEEFLKGKDEFMFLSLKEPLDEPTSKEILAYAMGNVGKPYGFPMLFRIAWEFLKRRKASALLYPSEVCSSLVYDCFKYIGIELVEGSRYVTPDDIADSDKLIPDIQ